MTIYMVNGQSYVTLCLACFEEWPDEDELEFVGSSLSGKCSECEKIA